MVLIKLAVILSSHFLITRIMTVCTSTGKCSKAHYIKNLKKLESSESQLNLCQDSKFDTRM